MNKTFGPILLRASSPVFFHPSSFIVHPSGTCQSARVRVRLASMQACWTEYDFMDESVAGLRCSQKRGG
jgi:hypothetical protein